MKTLAKDTLFTRVYPSQATEPLATNWVAVSHRFLETKDERRNAYGRWVKISSAEGSIYRVIRFSPRLKSKGKDTQILIDYAGWLVLTGFDEDTNKPLELTIKKASIFCYLHMALTSPEPLQRNNTVLALIGLALGVISLVVSFL